MSTRTARALALLGLLGLFGTAACAGPTAADDGAAASDAFSEVSHTLTDAQLAAAFAKAPAGPTSIQANLYFAETVNPVATTKRLAMLNAYMKKGDKAKYDIYETMAFQMEALVLGTPRDLTAAPAGFGGQSFATTIVTDDSSLGPTKLSVAGTSKTAYTLSFTIGGIALQANVPAGATATATAALIGNAIKGSAERVAGSDGFKNIGGDSSGSPSGVDDVEVTVDGATVSLVVALNG